MMVKLSLIDRIYILFLLVGWFYPVVLHAQTNSGVGAWYVQNFTGSSPEKRHESSFVEVNNKFYLIGGRGTKKVQVYDPITKVWTNTNTTTADINHFQGVAYNGKIYIIGAFTGPFPTEDPVPNILMYDPVLDQIITGSPIPSNRLRGSCGLVLHNNKFYLIGGNRNGHSAFMEDGVTPANVSWFDEYDPVTNTWTTIARCPGP
ncbi:MAG: hypothetical protein HC880_16230 [Bacteroidia bacterium]|nr:hypothetical protein [Bacteroidia bacterium]